MDKMFLNIKEIIGAVTNRRAKKIKLLQIAQELKTISDTFNKQTKLQLETVSKQ